ncbi:MAG: DMT family transporter [Synergistaceae bacterium]|nr:DMT family transporter [Synergistaceae bacterium]
MSMLVALMWAVSPVLMKEGLKFCTPSDVPAIRSISFILAMVFFMIVTRSGAMPHMTPRLFAGVLGSALLSSLLGDLLYTFSVQKIGASLAVSVSSGYPFVTAVMSIFLLNERIGPLVWLGTVMIIGGILVIKIDASRQERAAAGYVLEDFEERRMKRANITKGISFALGSALCSGINIPIIKILMTEGGWSPTESYFLRSVAFFFMAWTMREAQHRFAPEAIRPIEKLPLRAWISLLSSGLIGIALSGILFATCIERFPVSVITPITASSPFMTLVLARLILKEKLSRAQSAGVVIVIAGSISVSL